MFAFGIFSKKKLITLSIICSGIFLTINQCSQSDHNRFEDNIEKKEIGDNQVEDNQITDDEKNNNKEDFQVEFVRIEENQDEDDESGINIMPNESDLDILNKSFLCENSEVKPIGIIKGETRLFFGVELDGIDYGVFRMHVYDDNAILLFEDPKIVETFSLGFIHNFPDFPEEWKNPKGTIVFYEGIVYPNCKEVFCRYFCFNIVLTKLIIK